MAGENTAICFQCCIRKHLDNLYTDTILNLGWIVLQVSFKDLACLRHLTRSRQVSLNVVAVPAGHQQRLIKVMDDLMSCGANSDTVLNILR